MRIHQENRFNERPASGTKRLEKAKHYVICEGAKTEPLYFREIQNRCHCQIGLSLYCHKIRIRKRFTKRFCISRKRRKTFPLRFMSYLFNFVPSSELTKTTKTRPTIRKQNVSYQKEEKTGIPKCQMKRLCLS